MVSEASFLKQHKNDMEEKSISKDNRQRALKYASIVHSGSLKVDPSKVIETAQMFLKYLNNE